MAQELAPLDVVGPGLTDAQERLVDAISGGLSGEEPLDVVGAGYVNMRDLGAAARSETVQGELKSRRTARIKTTLAQKALKAIENLIESEKTPAATRFTAAKWLLEQAGHTSAQDDAKDKPLAEMKEHELEAFILRAQKVVEGGGEPPLIKVTP